MKRERNLLDFFTCPPVNNRHSTVRIVQKTPPTPATPCTPLTPQTPSSHDTRSHSSSSSNSSSNSSSSRYETPLATPQTPATPASSSSSSSSSTPTSEKESHGSDVIKKRKTEEKDSSSSCNARHPTTTTATIIPEKEHEHPHLHPDNKKKHKQKKQKQQQQLYLDFGQASFGSRSICPTCQTLVVHGIREDEIQHEKICKEFQMGVAVPLNLLKNMRIVSNVSSIPFTRSSSSSSKRKKNDREGCIVEVRPTDCLTWRRKVLQVQRIVEQELGFVRGGGGGGGGVTRASSLSVEQSFQETGKRKRQSMGDSTTEKRSHTPINCSSDNNDGDDDDTSYSLGNKKVYLYIVEKRVVGFCSVEVISRAFEMYLHSKTVEPSTTNSSKSTMIWHNNHCCDGTITRSMKPSKAILGVYQLWCHKLHRQKGIARQLVDAARSKCIFGMTVPPCWVAFSSPTWDGARFAKEYSHPHVPLVYELS